MKITLSTLFVLALFAQALPAAAGGSCCASDAQAEATSCAKGESQMMVHTASATMPEGMDMSRAVDHSASIAVLLAADEIAGVADHAKAMAKSLGLENLQPPKGDGHDEHAANIASQLAILSEASLSLEDARTAFLRLQESFIPLAVAAYEAGEDGPEWAIFNCGMVKGSWIQVDGKVSNPFYGSKMLRCGSRVATLEQAQEASAGEASAHEDHSGSAHSH